MLGFPILAWNDYQEFNAATQYAGLGVRAALGASGSQFFALWWQGHRLYVAGWTMFKDRPTSRKALSFLKSAAPGEAAGGSPIEVWIRREISPQQAENMGERLRACVLEWCGYGAECPEG